MREFVVFLCIGLALAAPEGYNYQIELGPSGENNIQAIPNQYRAIGQYSSQQQPQTVYREQFAGEAPQLSQTYSLDKDVLQVGGQFLKNAQVGIQFEQQYQTGEKNLSPFIQPAQVVEPPKLEIQDQYKPIEAPPQFIIKHKAQPDESLQSSPAQKRVTFQKEFYYLSAPQEEYESPKELDDQLDAIKKKLRVVFIKAPENNGIEKAALQLAQQSANAQTAIYVLTKQHDASELANKLESIKSTPQRPEVAFIKYRTPEEAEHAQRVIQAQYEALDGPNHINIPDTGVTHDFVGSTVGSVDPRKSNRNTEVKSEEIGASKPVVKYLPASVKH